jgi:hypothetical protein
MREIGEERAVRVEELSPDGHGEHDVLAVSATAAAPLAVTAAPGGETALSPESAKIAQACIRDDDDVPAVAAVTSVGAALGNVLLSAEADGAVAPAAAVSDDACAIVEHARLEK